MARARGDADDARGTTGEEGEAEGRASATKIFGVFARRRDVVVAAGPRGAVVEGEDEVVLARGERADARVLLLGGLRLRGGGVLVVGAVGAGTRRLGLERERLVVPRHVAHDARDAARVREGDARVPRGGEDGRGERAASSGEGVAEVVAGGVPPDLEAVGRRGAVGIIVLAHLDRDESPSPGEDATRGAGPRGSEARQRRGVERVVAARQEPARVPLPPSPPRGGGRRRRHRAAGGVSLPRTRSFLYASRHRAAEHQLTSQECCRARRDFHEPRSIRAPSRTFARV